MQTRYSKEFKEQALSKVLQRGDKSIQSIADELNISVFTLKGWLKQTRSNPTTKTMKPQRPKDWTREQRFEALVASAGLEGESLNAFCRERGLFTHHLHTWKQDFIKPLEVAEPSNVSRKAAKPLQDEIDQLKKDLQRKEKALAEAAALLILQKKCQAFWEEKAS
jgi:transposase-like protein